MLSAERAPSLPLCFLADRIGRVRSRRSGRNSLQIPARWPITHSQILPTAAAAAAAVSTLAACPARIQSSHSIARRRFARARRHKRLRRAQDCVRLYRPNYIHLGHLCHQPTGLRLDALDAAARAPSKASQGQSRPAMSRRRRCVALALQIRFSPAPVVVALAATCLRDLCVARLDFGRAVPIVEQDLVRAGVTLS